MFILRHLRTTIVCLFKLAPDEEDKIDPDRLCKQNTSVAHNGLFFKAIHGLKDAFCIKTLVKKLIILIMLQRTKTSYMYRQNFAIAILSVNTSCILYCNVFLQRSSADSNNCFNKMASGRRPEHQAPPEVVRLLCFWYHLRRNLWPGNVI